MVKAVLFDFWGTLAENGDYSPVRQAKRILGVDMTFSQYIVLFENILMTKKYEDLTEAFTEVCKAFNVKPSKSKIDQLIGLWNKNRLMAKVFPDTIETLEFLKKNHYQIGLLTNTDCFSVEPLLEKFGIKKYFDVSVFSYEAGLLKTDPKMLKLALNKLKVKEKDAIMVGDSLESDMLGAQNASVKGILLDRRDRREYKDKIKSLLDLKTFLK